MIEVMEAIKKGIKLVQENFKELDRSVQRMNQWQQENKEKRGNGDLDWVLRKLRALNRMASIEKIYGIKNNERS
jgi:hypothetical protein